MNFKSALIRCTEILNEIENATAEHKEAIEILNEVSLGFEEIDNVINQIKEE